MRELACKGKIDGAIVRDLDAFLSRLGFLPNEIKGREQKDTPTR